MKLGKGKVQDISGAAGDEGHGAGRTEEKTGTMCKQSRRAWSEK
jgi:hypothetical protein